MEKNLAKSYFEGEYALRETAKEAIDEILNFGGISTYANEQIYGVYTLLRLFDEKREQALKEIKPED